MADFEEVLGRSNLQGIPIINIEKLDLIVGIHVLDHLVKPLDILKDLHSRASENSTLAVVVHNEKSILRKILARKWPPFCLQHPQIFNPSSLSKILELSGWEVFSVERTKNHYSVQNLGSLALEIFGITNSFSKLWPKIDFPIYLGNVMVIARKVS